MANHVNRQLREAAIVLLTGLPTTGARVHSYRVNPLDGGTELPALIVRAPADSAEPQTIHSGLYQRSIELVVTAYAAAVADLDDTLDEMRKEIETALGVPFTVGGRQVDAVYQGSSLDMIAGERPAAELELRFRVDLYHAANAPDVLL